MVTQTNIHQLKVLVSRYSSRIESILLTVMLIVCVSFVSWTDVAAADAFGCFVGAGNPAAATCNNQPALTSSTDGNKCTENVEGVGDWNTTITNTNNDVTVISIHGGKIEPGTTDISADLQDLYNWNRYDFNGHVRNSACLGLRSTLNPSCTVGDTYCLLHITSENFNDPDALNLVENHPRAVSIHGCGSSTCSNNTICIGGSNVNTRNTVRNYINQYKTLLTNAPLTYVNAQSADTGASCSSGILGTSLNNIVNRTTTDEGIQLEISRNIRDTLADNSINNDLLRGIIYGAVAEGVGELPLPILTFENKVNNQYNFNLANENEYPAELFNPSNLPACPGQTQSFRTWVNIFNASNNQLIARFCNFSSPQDLDSIQFSIASGTTPPAAVYITLEDRLNNRIYSSNRVSLP